MVPAIHQIELHPYFNQPELREYHAANGIVTESWSPLGQGGGELEDPVITGIAEAEARGVTVLHAGTRTEDDHLLADGGRVLDVVARGSDLTHARENAYAGLSLIDLPGGWARTDIAAEAAAGRITL